MAEKQDLAAIVGADRVYDDTEVLESYASDLSFTRRVPPRLVVKPGDASQVQALVKWSNQTKTPLVPVSSGPPRFRGDTVPAAGGAVIVDFSEMKQIQRIDRRNRVAMIEPGVTFDELTAALAEEKMRPFLPLLPRATKSVLACHLEREPIISPKHHWDIGDPMLCSEVIFGCGELFRTGSAAGPGSMEDQRKSGQAQKYPAGPSQASLHRIIQGAQGTMGCVTWITLKTQLIPEIQKPYLVSSDRLEGLHELAHWIIRLRIADECFILNNADMAAIYSNDGYNVFRELGDRLPPYILFFNVTGYEYFPEERIAWQEAYITHHAQRIGVSPVPSIGDVSAERVLQLLQSSSAEPYWKLRPKGSCHDILFLTGRDNLSKHVETMRCLAADCGYQASDMGIYIQPIVQGTSWHCEFNLFFDPEDKRQAAAVKKISSEAVSVLMAEGAFFSRPYGAWADTAYRRDAETTSALRKVKGIFDENHVMNPGKLCF